MKKTLFAGLFLSLLASSASAFASASANSLATLKGSALGDIRHVVAQQEMIPNPKFLLLDETSYDCSVEETILTCSGWYGFYAQNPENPGAETVFGEFTIRFTTQDDHVVTIVDETVSRIDL